MNITLLEPLGIPAEHLQSLANGLTSLGHFFTAYDYYTADPTELIRRCQDSDIVILANHPLPGEVICAAEHLRFISVAFVGIDHVDTQACKEKGIVVSNTGGYCTDAVAELTIGLVIDCLRHISALDRQVAAGGGKSGPVGHELRNKTVGIIGTGEIGQRVSALFSAFGCRILGYSRPGSQRSIPAYLGIESSSLDNLMERSDIISIHTPLTPETRGLIGKAQIAKMKKGAILINTARGPVVDTNALADALKEGRIFAGIDVYEADPPLPKGHPLLDAPNLVRTPHIGFDTEESILRRADMAFENVHAWLNSSPVRVMLS